MIGLELPGHESDDIPEHPMRTAVERVREAVLDRPEPPLLVGLSYLGAAVVLRAAAGLGAAVRGVVVSGYSFTVDQTTLRRWLTGFTRMAQTQPRSAAHFAALHGPRWPRLLSATLDELGDGCLALPDRDDLARLESPVMLVNGALLENERRAVEPASRAGADVAVVAGAGHVVPQDSPRTFAALIEEFTVRIDERRTVFHHRRQTSDQARVPWSSDAERDSASA
ncbi:pimeloyl-ACP methyl ester carboxylesterase [Actinoalloteichus hoggarensis]|uniref:Alpha/beta hydrolase family protein n=1 Tax=Actinoalloteichus hoggarensis TaxID=1470176 RepID=A0A221W4Z7_9PSEU|nr:alpha/beta hydrolase [Actinoalloteichus hoggarensis]ASO20669.1 Alpha/beta hydrolase family protein [Actinoalloteichus hoggarensis]MBB5924478.1 pimeloyl-ACP methyl ester carboxylesterase [Actinoalloteichus hoggarensis]